MKFVVTGATGLIGGAVARHLKAQGHEVIAVDRREGEVGDGIKLIIGDLFELEFADSVINGADHVVHMGAIPNPIDSRQYTVFRNNSVSTFAVFTAAAQAKVKSVVYASSLSAYGFAYSDKWTSPLYVPMDEALTRVAIDVSGRPFLVFKAKFGRDKVGAFDTELVQEWFQAFAMNAGITLHVEVLYGSNDHHIAESCFKGLARALRAAFAIDLRAAGEVPSTVEPPRSGGGSGRTASRTHGVNPWP